MTYTKLHCPSCGKVVCRGSYTGEKPGMPIRRCSHCGENYIDPTVHELAVEGFSLSDCFPNYSFVWLSIFVIVLFFGFFNNSPVTMLISLSLIVLTIICSVLIMKKKYVEMDKEMKQSEERMRNKEYVEELIRLGYIAKSQITDKK